VASADAAIPQSSKIKLILAGSFAYLLSQTGLLLSIILQSVSIPRLEPVRCSTAS